MIANIVTILWNDYLNYSNQLPLSPTSSLIRYNRKNIVIAVQPYTYKNVSLKYAILI